MLLLGAATLNSTDQPGLNKLSVSEINKVQPPPKELFPVPFSPKVPFPSSMSYGGMFLWWHDSTYYMTYDCHPHELPLYLLTSKDGVYWKHEGAWFEKDRPEQDLLNPEIYKLKPDGPWVMAYGDPLWFKLAISDGDMWDWKRLGPVGGFTSHSELREAHPQYPKWFTTPVSHPHPDGGWFHLVYAQSMEYIGMGYARSQDGIHYEILSPVRFEGVPCDRFLESPLLTKGGETAGISKIGDKYFFSGGGRQGDWFLVADRPEGPYRPTPKNHTIPRGPENFWRIYNDVPDGPLISASCYAYQKNPRQWIMMPLKRLVSDGESVWIKWWEGNENLKAHQVALAVGKLEAGVVGVEPSTDSNKVTVIEGMIDFHSVRPEEDFARGSKPSVSMTHTFGPGSMATGAEDYLGAQHLVDGLDERSWIGDLTGVAHDSEDMSGMDKEQLVAFIKSKSESAVASIDLGRVRPIGRINARWTRCPGVPSFAAFQMDYIKGTRLSISTDGKAWREIPVSYLDSYRLNYENLSVEARYLKFTFPPLNITADRLDTPNERSTYRVVGLAMVNIHEAGQHNIARPNGLPGITIGREGELDEAILFDPSGKVLMGEVKKGDPAFRHRETRNIEVPFPEETKFRLIVTADLIEVYVNDYFIEYIETKTPLTGEIGIIQPSAVGDLKAWTASPNHSQYAGINR